MTTLNKENKQRQDKFILTVEDSYGRQFEVPAYANSMDDMLNIIDKYYESAGFKVNRIKADYQHNVLSRN